MWEILQRCKVTIEKLHGFKPHIKEFFLKNWSKERVSLDGVTVDLTEDFISEIISLYMEGMNFKKETSISNEAI